MVNQTAPHSGGLPVAAKQSQDTEAPLPTDTSRPAHIGLWVLGLGFGGFLLWSSLAPLDEGVPTSGIVTLDTKRKTIQHLSGGIVKEIFVKEGEFVKAGMPLVRIDDATPRLTSSRSASTTCPSARWKGAWSPNRPAKARSPSTPTCRRKPATPR